MTDLLTRSDATISECGLYRYRLTREWGAGATAVFIMLNPSTADASQDDPTIRRCVGFAKREGCGRLEVVNLFAFRATAPKDMRAAADPIGPENDAHILAAVTAADGPRIAAWGAHGGQRGKEVGRRLRGMGLKCLGLTAALAPRHPLYVRGDAPLVAY